MKYLLVLGTQRTGKTLIGRALNMHPNVIVQAEPYFYFFKLCRNIFYRDILKKPDFDPDYPMDSCFCRCYKERKLFDESFSRIYFNESDIKELIGLTIKQQEVSKGERAIKIIPFLRKLNPGTSVSVFKSLMDILFEGYAKDDVKVVGITEGWCDEFIGPLFNIKDIDIKCVHCLRDPRAIVASRNGGSRLHVGKYPLLFIIRHWRKAVAYSMLHAGDPRYMAVQYEDLIQDPEMWFRRICAFLNMPFSDKMIDPSTYTKGDGNPWEQNSAFEVSSDLGFSNKSVSRWKEILSREEVGVIEYLCEAEMKYLRIPRSAQEFSLKELLNFREDEEKIVEWLKKYKFIFNEKELTLEIIRKYIMSEGPLMDIDNFIDYFTIDKNVLKIIAQERNGYA